MPGFVLDPVIFISMMYVLTSLRNDVQSVLMMYLIGVFTCNTAAACGESGPPAVSRPVARLLTSGWNVRRGR